MDKYFKLARPDGFDFYTGKTINYRDSIGKIVSPPRPDKDLGLCSSGLIHASKDINDCFVWANIPCSAYVVEGESVAYDNKKSGFLFLKVIEEITDLDTAFGWKYTEAINPINPLKVKAILTKKHKELLKQWIEVPEQVGGQVRRQVWDQGWDQVLDQVWDQVWRQVWDQVRDQVGGQVRDQFWGQVRRQVWVQVGGQVRDQVWDQVLVQVRDQVLDQVWAYLTSLFPLKWDNDQYPLQLIADLWKDGFIVSYDGKTWRLHAGEQAAIVYEYKKVEVI